MMKDYNYPHLKKEVLQLLSSCVLLYMISFSTPSATISTTNTNTISPNSSPNSWEPQLWSPTPNPSVAVLTLIVK